MSKLETRMHRLLALNLSIMLDPMETVTTGKITHLLLRVVDVQLVVNYSVDRPSHLHQRRQQPLRPRDRFRRQPMKSPCHWGIYFTWLIIPAIRDQTRHAASYFKTCLKKAKLVGALVAGIVVLLLLPMIDGTPVVKHLVKLVSLFVKSVVFGASCNDPSRHSVAYFSICYLV